MSSVTRTLVAVLALGCAVVTANAWVFTVEESDTEASVRAKVLSGARLHLGGDTITTENVAAFLQPIETALARVELRIAETAGRYVTGVDDAVGYLASGEANALIRSFRLIYLSGIVRGEVETILVRVVRRYDEQRADVAAIAAGLADTIAEIESTQDIVDAITTRALENVRIAQQSTESLVNVISTYRAIIEDQREMLSVGVALDRAAERRPAVSLLAGPLWYYGPDERLASFTGAVGALVSVPMFRRVHVGIGAITSFPPSSSAILVQLGFIR